MDKFMLASREKLRVQTSKGLLSVEQLWELPVTELDSLAVSLEEEANKSKGKSFLVKRVTKDATAKLKFDIALEILQTKVAEAEEAKQKKEDKEHNEKILALIMDKKDQSLKGKSIKELEKMLR